MYSKLYEIEYWYSPSNNLKDIQIKKDLIIAKNNFEASKNFYLKFLSEQRTKEEEVQPTIKAIKRILYYIDINHTEKE